MHAEQAEARSVRDATSWSHVSGELDGRLCFPGAGQTTGRVEHVARRNRQAA